MAAVRSGRRLPDGVERGACALYAFMGPERRLAMADSPGSTGTGMVTSTRAYIAARTKRSMI